MARSSYQKLKPIYIMDYLLKNSDEQHPVTITQLIEYLAAQGIQSERKSIYGDLEALQFYGLDIVQSSLGRSAGYYIANRSFELPELKLLVDSVQSSKFITHKKTATLIRKIETLASIHEAQLLDRQVFVTNRIKTMNESIYYNVDAIHHGISTNCKIQFRYFEYTVSKERRYRKEGAFYVVSPFAMTWDDENYYMVAFDSEAGIIKHYRVDKMTDISTLDQARDGVQLRFENHLVGAVLDRLGRDVFLVADGDDHFTVRADVVVSPQFFAWVTGFGSSAQIIGPNHVVEEMRQHIDSVATLYHGGNSSTNLDSEMAEVSQNGQ